MNYALLGSLAINFALLVMASRTWIKLNNTRRDLLQVAADRDCANELYKSASDRASRMREWFDRSDREFSELLNFLHDNGITVKRASPPKWTITFND